MGTGILILYTLKVSLVRVLSAILAKSNMLPQLFNVVGINLSVTQFGYFAKVISIIDVPQPLSYDLWIIQFQEIDV